MSLEALAAQSDDHLVREVLGGQRDAYGELVRRYERHVHAAAWAILRDHHDAQDVAQDTFVKAYYQLAALRTPATVAPWFLTIARPLATDRRRTRSRLVFVSAVPDIQTLDALAQEDAALVLNSLARLPDHEQQAVLLRYFDDLPVAEIAAVLDRPVGTVTKQISRALKRLRDHLWEM